MSHPPGLSRRGQTMPASPIRRLAPLAVQAQRAGKTVHSLNIGQPDIPTPRVILDRLRGYDAAYVPYGPSQGLPEFVEALRGYYSSLGFALDPSEIFVTTGGSEAILFTLGALCDPGDQILVFEPFYRVDKSRSRSTGGYGLGLSLCRTILEKHGGSVTITSDAREGTIVALRLPGASETPT